MILVTVMTRRAILWFRNDLRLRDNQLFNYKQVCQAKELLAVYCIDPRHFVKSTWGEHPRIAPHRLRFLAESLEDLDQSLQRLGSKLWVVSGQPEDVLPSLLGPGDALAFQREDTTEEQAVEAAVLERLPQGISALRHLGCSVLGRGAEPPQFWVLLIWLEPGISHVTWVHYDATMCFPCFVCSILPVLHFLRFDLCVL